MTTKTIQMYRTNLDGSETTLYPLTEAKYVTMDDGTTIEEALTNSDSSKYSPVIESSKAMFKVGEGDSVDLSESAIDGAYNSCVLKGKTMVNCIQEPSSQDVVLPYEFEDGQYVTINDTKESGALGVELKGQTLVNLVPKKIIDYTASSDWDGYHQLVQNSKQSFDQWRALQDLKPNTKYYISCYVETFEVVNNEGYCLNNPSVESIFGDSMIVNGVGRYQWLSTTKSELTDEIFMALRCQNALARGAIKIRDIMIIEYQQGMENWDIPYFEGMQSVKLPILQTIGKNLFNGKVIENKAIDFVDGNLYDSEGYNAVDYYTPVLPNDNIVISNENGILESNTFIFYNFNKKYVSFTNVNGKVTIPENVYYVRAYGISSILKGNIQIEKGTQVTSYEPYKSSILSLPEEVVLRSLPNGVCDTFNMRTSVYTQRVYETTITGTEGWVQYDVSNTNRQETIAFSANLGLGEIFDNEETYSKLGGIVCDKLNHINSVWGTNKDIEGISADQRNVIVQIKKTRLASEDVAGFKTWLTSNNLKVGIQLKVPTITKINLSSTLKSWNTTTHIYSEIPENTLYPILSHSNPTYPVILKPSTKYSIVANSYSNDHTNSAINFNLGGATASATVGSRVTTITTPSTLSNELLTMSGRGNKLNNVMVIEGDVAGDEPYFEGICDVKSPILLNTGKNLFNIHDYSPYEFTFSGDYPKELNSVYEDRLQIVDDEIHYKTMGNNHHLNQGVGYYIPLKPNTKYTFKASRKFGDRLWALKLFLIHQDERLGGVKSPIQEPTRFGYSSENNSDPVEATFNSSKYNCLMVYIGGGWENGAKGQRSYIFNDISLVEEGQEIEPYKSNTTTFEQKDDKTIVLRSLPNGVCDTLNVETGEYVQRIGEATLNGASGEVWAESYSGWSNKVFCVRNNSLPDIAYVDTSTINVVSDKLPARHIGDLCTGSKTGIASHSWSTYYCQVAIIGVNTLDQMKQWIQANPMTVQYQLKTPIVRKVDISGFPYAYKDGHVILSSGSVEQSLTPKVEYSLVANRNGQIETNTKQIRRHQDKLDDFEALMLTQMVQSHYEKTLLQFNYEMQMMALGGE